MKGRGRTKVEAKALAGCRDRNEEGHREAGREPPSKRKPAKSAAKGAAVANVAAKARPTYRIDESIRDCVPTEDLELFTVTDDPKEAAACVMRRHGERARHV